MYQSSGKYTTNVDILIVILDICLQQRPMFPVEVPEVYEPMVEQQHSSHLAPQPAPGWAPSKRSSKPVAPQSHHHHHHHSSSSNQLVVPGASHRQDKKEATQLSPVKKRVKEGTPPSGMYQLCNTRQYIATFTCKTFLIRYLHIAG